MSEMRKRSIYIISIILTDIFEFFWFKTFNDLIWFIVFNATFNKMNCELMLTYDTPAQATGKLYHLQLRVECTFFVIYKAGRVPTPYWW
jgi:hypothetical protein